MPRTYSAGAILIIGANDIGNSIYRKLVQRPLAYQVIGFLDDEKSPDFEGTTLGKLRDLEHIVDDNALSMVIVALPSQKLEKLDWIVSVCQDRSVEVKIIPDLGFVLFPKGYNYSFLGDIPVVAVDINRLSEAHWRLAKRIMDLGLTLILGVVILSWLLPVVYACPP